MMKCLKLSLEIENTSAYFYNNILRGPLYLHLFAEKDQFIFATKARNHYSFCVWLLGNFLLTVNLDFDSSLAKLMPIERLGFQSVRFEKSK